MAAFGRKRKEEPKTLTASVATAMFDTPTWHTMTAEQAWQAELWRLYDCVPEFSRGANWVGQACSRVRLYVAEIDDRGEVQREVPARNPVGRLANKVLGGPTKRADLLRLAGMDLTVSGEFWLVAFSDAVSEDDRWLIVSGSELKRIENALVARGTDPYIEMILQLPEETRPEIYQLKTGTGTRYLVEGRDIVARVWTSYPYQTWQADSPGRSLQMVLIELEILTQYILAQARSRLASGGVWPWPAQSEFPTSDSESVGAESVMQRMSDAAQANLTKFGGASQLMPILIEMPIEIIEKMIPPFEFGSVLSSQAMDLRKELRERLASGMDVQPEIISGMGDATHWNGPQIEQSTVDTVIVPLMTRICDALTEVYLWPILKKMGKDPKKYRFWFDIAPLVTRPNRLKEALEMWNLGLISWEEVLLAADLPESAKMSKEEQAEVLARKLLLSDPNMILIPELRKLAGLPIKSVVPDGQPVGEQVESVAGRPPAPPPPERTLKVAGRGEAPERSTLPNAPNNATPGTQNSQPRAMTASVVSPDELALTVGTDAMVRQALEKVGKALTRGHGRGSLPFDEVYLSQLHVRDEGHARALLASCFGHAGALMDHMGRSDQAEHIREVLIDYTSTLLVDQRAHEVRIMRGHLEREGLL